MELAPKSLPVELQAYHSSGSWCKDRWNWGWNYAKVYIVCDNGRQRRWLLPNSSSTLASCCISTDNQPFRRENYLLNASVAVAQPGLRENW